MFDRTRIRYGCQASICLDCGADEAACLAGDLEISRRGMRFKSPWQFSLGSQLDVALRCIGEDGEPSRVSVEGLVVDCQEITPHSFHVTVLFLDLPENSHEALAGISLRLDAETAETAGV